MENFNSINTVSLDREEALAFAIHCEETRDFSQKLNAVTVGLSSGTSGSRGIFLVSDKERALWAGTMLAKALPKGQIFGHRIALFMRADSELYETIQSRIIQFKFFDLFFDLQQQLQDLEKFQPTILVAPPSILLEISRWNQNQKKMMVKKVFAIAEVLEPEDAQRICKALGVKIIHQIYQCTEGFLGITCEFGNLHLNENFIRFEKEMIDEKRFFPIITDLRRRAQPIVHYKLNDILVLREEACPCGQKTLALEKIEGREDDIFIFSSSKNGNDLSSRQVLPDFIRRCVLFSQNQGEYRVIQSSEQEVIIMLENRTDQVEEEITQEFKKLANHFMFKMPTLYFESYDYDYHKKLRRIESHVKHKKS